jgi:hypothetical protein
LADRNEFFIFAKALQGKEIHSKNTQKRPIFPYLQDPKIDEKWKKGFHGAGIYSNEFKFQYVVCPYAGYKMHLVLKKKHSQQ